MGGWPLRPGRLSQIANRGGGGSVPIGVPVAVGTAIAQASTIAATTAVVATVDSPPGTMVVVLSFTDSGSSFTSVTDSAGNTWSTAATITIVGKCVNISYCKLTNDIPILGTITTTWSSATGRKFQFAYQVPNATAFDIAGAGAQATSTSPTITTGALARATSIVMTFLEEDSLATTFTEDAAFTSLANAITGTRRARVSYDIVAATTAVTYAPTFGSSVLWTLNYAVFDD